MLKTDIEMDAHVFAYYNFLDLMAYEEFSCSELLAHPILFGA